MKNLFNTIDLFYKKAQALDERVDKPYIGDPKKYISEAAFDAYNLLVADKGFKDETNSFSRVLSTYMNPTNTTAIDLKLNWYRHISAIVDKLNKEREDLKLDQKTYEEVYNLFYKAWADIVKTGLTPGQALPNKVLTPLENPWKNTDLAKISPSDLKSYENFPDPWGRTPAEVALDDKKEKIRQNQFFTPKELMGLGWDPWISMSKDEKAAYKKTVDKNEKERIVAAVKKRNDDIAAAVKKRNDDIAADKVFKDIKAPVSKEIDKILSRPSPPIPEWEDPLKTRSSLKTNGKISSNKRIRDLINLTK